jgi:hypothetical protein
LSGVVTIEDEDDDTGVANAGGGDSRGRVGLDAIAMVPAIGKQKHVGHEGAEDVKMNMGINNQGAWT